MSILLRTSTSCLQSAIRGHRLYTVSNTAIQALDKWTKDILAVERKTQDWLSLSKIRDVYCSLPTRSSTQLNGPAIQHGAVLPYGHSLAFFHSSIPEEELSPDGTEMDFNPPEPFTRRMWASGRIDWPVKSSGHDEDGLRMGYAAEATAFVESVQKKSFEKGTPMVFVNQKIVYRHMPQEGGGGIGNAVMREKRTHAFLPHDMHANKRAVKNVLDLPKPGFSYSWTPTGTSLFRFSAFMFNAHLVHLDPVWSKEVEGYPERLVHGPLTALMLLEGLIHVKPNARLSGFEYRARNPVYVDRKQTIYGAFDHDRRSVVLWAADEDNIVGMTGKADIADPNTVA